MHIYQHDSNKWFNSGSLQRIFFHITQAVNERTAWLRFLRGKYIQIRVDLRTGDYLILDGAGSVMTNEEIKKLFKGIEIESSTVLNLKQE
jgi:hypothetical protein